MPGECRRCGGTGRVEYQFGPPGTDRHARYIDVEWGEPYERECPLCTGTGWGSTPRKPTPTQGSLVLHATESQLQKALKRLPTKRRNAR